MCFCGDKKEFEECCKLFLDRKEIAKTALEMMKSRYSAFVVGDIDYIIETHHEDTAGELQRENIEIWSKESKWLGLEILEAIAGEESDDEGIVEFVAKYRADGFIHNHRERSLFKKVEGRWCFHSQLDTLPLAPKVKVGRNEPCPCNSGRKFKKCCGKA